MLDLKGRWVLVTGAARGIGRLAALKMAEQGCNLILHSRDTSHTASLEEELKAKGIDCHSVAADLNDISSVLKMLEKIDALGVDVDIVLNNAGFQSVITAQKIARHEIMCTIDDVCAAAQKLLKFGGRLCVCNRPERLSDVIYAMKSHDIEPKRLRMVSKNADEAPWLFLIEGKKDSKPFMKVEPQLYIRSENGFSEELQKIYDTGKEQL